MRKQSIDEFFDGLEAAHDIDSNLSAEDWETELQLDHLANIVVRIYLHHQCKESNHSKKVCRECNEGDPIYHLDKYQKRFGRRNKK